MFKKSVNIAKAIFVDSEEGVHYMRISGADNDGNGSVMWNMIDEEANIMKPLNAEAAKKLEDAYKEELRDQELLALLSMVAGGVRVP